MKTKANRFFTMLLALLISCSAALSITTVYSKTQEQKQEENKEEIFTNYTLNLAVSAEVSALSGKDKDCISITLPERTRLNTVVLTEKGDEVTEFKLYYKTGEGNYEFFYRQDLIGDYRYCTFPMLETDALRVEITSTKSGSWSLNKPEIYKMGKTAADDFRVTAYVVCDRIQSEKAVDEKHFQKINHINYFNAYFDRNGDLSCLGGEEVFSLGLKNLRAKMQNGTVIVVTILSKNLPGEMLSTSEIYTSVLTENKQKLITNINNFLDKYGFDGVSFDWEYPENNREWDMFFELCDDFKATSSGKLFTAAIGSWYLKMFQLDYALLDKLDIIEVMSYDIFDKNGYHSTFDESCYQVIQNVKAYARLGDIDISKKCDLGLPFYSRPTNAYAYWSDYTALNKGKFYNINEEDIIYNGVLLDAQYFNGYQMIYDKTAYCLDNDFGGVMVWHYSCDYPSDNPLSLWSAIGEAVSSRS